MAWDILFTSQHFFMWIIPGITLLGQLTTLTWSFLTRSEKGAAAVFQWTCILAAVAPFAVALPMVFRSHYGKIASLDAIKYFDAAEKAVLLASGVGEYKSYWILGGLAFMALCLVGFISVLTSWLRMKRYTTPSLVPLLAFGGLSVAIGLLSMGLIKRGIALIKEYSAISFADAAEKAILLEYGFAKAPTLWPYLLEALAAMAIAFLIIVIVKIIRKREFSGVGKWPVASGVLILFLGTTLFASTRYHAKDANSISELFKTLPREGEILFIPKDIRFPKLKNTQSLSMAPVIVAVANQVIMEYISIGRADEIIQDKNMEIPYLLERLEKLKQNFRQLHPERPFPGMMILQFDKDTPGQVVAKVLRTCYRAEYRKIQIVTDGLLKISTAVLGNYVRISLKAVLFELTDRPEENIISLPGKEKFWQWANLIDKATTSGKVQVRVTQSPEAHQTTR